MHLGQLLALLILQEAHVLPLEHLREARKLLLLLLVQLLLLSGLVAVFYASELVEMGNQGQVVALTQEACNDCRHLIYDVSCDLFAKDVLKELFKG